MILFSFAMFVSFTGWSIAQASSITITGLVKDNLSHAPIANAQVSVEVDGGFAAFGAPVTITPTTSAQFTAPLLWGQRTIVYTNNQGIYSTTLIVPTIIPSAFQYAHIVVAKQGGSNIFGSKSRVVALSGPGAVYTENFQLDALQYGAFISGSVNDALTNNGIPEAQVYVICGQGYYNQFLTDNQGQFFGVVPLSTPKETCQVDVTAPLVPGGNSDNGQFNGISYKTYSQSVQLISGQLTQINPQLTQNTKQTAIIGTLRDATTGQPIPYALVSLVQSSGAVDISYNDTQFVTDIFGRYVMPVATDYPANLGYLTVNTNGALVASDSQSPYTAQQINESNKMEPGDVVELNFVMNKK